MKNSLFKKIIERSTDAVIVTGTDPIDHPEGPQIIFVNEAYERMTGYSREEVIGKTPRILQGTKTDRKELDKLRKAIENGEPGNAELINYKKSGEEFWTSISIFPIRDNSGAIEYWIGIKRDITEKRNKMRREKLIKDISVLVNGDQPFKKIWVTYLIGYVISYHAI